MIKALFPIAIAAAAITVAACSMSPIASAAPDGAAYARAANACTAAGLDSSEAPFADCVQSLRQPTFAQYRDDTIGRQAQAACSAAGYGGGEYQSCVANMDQTLFDAQDINAR